MAITAVEDEIFSELKKAGVLPCNPSLLELGEANWYGDVPYERLSKDICRLEGDLEKQIELLQKLIEVVRAQQSDMSWDVAKIFYRVFLDYRETVAIDFGGTEKSLKLDLNHPITLGREFDVVYNGGTAEHVFNVWQFFKTVHDHTASRGVMIHGAPFTGWIDHGFFNFNPTFFWDLAAANGYIVQLFLYTELTPLKIIKIPQREQLEDMAKNGQIGTNSHIYAVLKMPEDRRPFVTPQQGYYANMVSEQVKENWKTLR
ncbi:MAG: hypothetical protein A2X80_06615 [Geobacteraceae bacterium GWB2_52_12]|nr:MAG: hypothetical protein A2X80_06615 [Geobacteraceae bacterium GWB2_52_12]